MASPHSSKERMSVYLKETTLIEAMRLFDLFGTGKILCSSVVIVLPQEQYNRKKDFRAACLVFKQLA